MFYFLFVTAIVCFCELFPALEPTLSLNRPPMVPFPPSPPAAVVAVSDRVPCVGGRQISAPELLTPLLVALALSVLKSQIVACNESYMSAGGARVKAAAAARLKRRHPSRTPSSGEVGNRDAPGTGESSRPV